MVKVIASASIFYGLTVSAADLVAAARAFDKLEPTLLSLGLIKARREQGTLQAAAGAQAVAQLPVEAWDAVARQAVEAAVAEARAGMVAEVYGFSPEEAMGVVRQAKWMDGGGANRLEIGLGFPWMGEEDQMAVDAVLEAYGLALESNAIVTLDNPDETVYDTDTDDPATTLPSAMLIPLVLAAAADSAPLVPPARCHRFQHDFHRTRNAFAARKSVGYDVYAPYDEARKEVKVVDSGAFQLPAEAREAFTRFCNDFSVPAINAQGQLDFEPKFYLSASL